MRDVEQRNYHILNLKMTRILVIFIVFLALGSITDARKRQKIEKRVRFSIFIVRINQARLFFINLIFMEIYVYMFAIQLFLILDELRFV